MTVLSRPARAAAALVAALAAISACGTAATNSATGPIQYWLWDSGQQPGYQKCADNFQQQNPGLTINITQVGWTDYWSKITSGMIADTAPDVFTDHLSKFPQYVDLKVLRPLDELEATKDIEDSDFQPGLAELWKGQDGHRYGSPKDWDTIAMFYDVDKVKAAGIDPAVLRHADLEPPGRRHLREGRRPPVGRREGRPRRRTRLRPGQRHDLRPGIRRLGR